MSKDGAVGERMVCNHPPCDSFGRDVTPDVCAACPLRQIETPQDAKSRGLGDTLAKLTRAVGVRPCNGCEKRQRWLNKVVPYRR